MSLFESPPNLKRWRFTEAIVTVGTALLVQQLTRNLIGAHVYLLLYPAVLFACVRNGFWPGILATILAAAGSVYFFLEPAFAFSLPNLESDGFALACFVVTGILTSRYGQRLLTTRIGERKAGEELRAAKILAEEASLAKSQFLANMSHEIRTPLGAITGYLELAIEQNSDADIQQKLGAVKRNAYQLSKVLGEILDISKVESGRLEIESNQFSPLEVVKGVIALQQAQASKKGIKIRLSTSDSLPVSITTDRVRFQQIVGNLIENAIKFTNVGAVNVLIELKSEPRIGVPIDLEVAVNDTGPGLTHDQTLKLFRPFVQLDSSLTRRFGGTGLGLALARALARILGGDVQLQRSKPDEGSTFVFKINGGPFALPSPILSSPESKNTATSLAGMRILLVEDSPDNQYLISLYLRSAGVNVDLANNGLEAVEKSTLNTYDLILMDLQMPIMDGYQATERLRREGFTGPIVALTAHALRSEQERALQGGFTDYLIKPLLRQTLFDALGRHRTPAAVTFFSEY